MHLIDMLAATPLERAGPEPLFRQLYAHIKRAILSGALEVAASCDMRICTERVRLLTPEVGIGLVASSEIGLENGTTAAVSYLRQSASSEQ